MGKIESIIMNLSKVILSIDKFNDDLTIYAKEPWNTFSEAIVEKEPEGGLPEKASGFKYFLEVFLVKEFLEDWKERKNKSDEEIVQRIIQYAINDA